MYKMETVVDGMTDDSPRKLEFTKGAKLEEDQQQLSSTAGQQRKKIKETAARTLKQEAPQPTNTQNRLQQDGYTIYDTAESINTSS
jgi:hypothetical protein